MPTQVGFARVLTDRATFAYLSEVYILEQYRGKGLARRLLDVVMAHLEIFRPGKYERGSTSGTHL